MKKLISLIWLLFIIVFSCIAQDKKINLLARLDETSLDEATLKEDKWKMGDHPLIWYQETGNSRSFYTVFGHTPEAF